MIIFNTIAELRSHLASQRKAGKSISFVSTMGALHAGHTSLVEHGKELADITVAGIFLNPSHFAEGEDFDTYPRTLEADCEKLREVGCDIVFAPSVSEIYPNGLDCQAVVDTPTLSRRYCGHTRPHFFSAIATVVTKLLNIVQPDYSLFGEKDYQQLAVCRQLVETLNIPTQVIGVPTVRDEFGLALSSRNTYLTDNERRDAAALYRVLQSTRDKVLAGRNDFEALEVEALDELTEHGFQPDYLSLTNAHTLEPVDSESSEIAILCAANIRSVRLIDNITFSK